MPNRTVVWAYSWIDEDDVHVDALQPGLFYKKPARREFLQPLLDAIGEADIVTGHNHKRFDLLILNAECLLLNLPVLKEVWVEDSMKLPKSKGFKKGQDNLGHAMGVTEKKMAMSWAEWEEAYGEDDLATVKERCASDVRMHKAMRAEMIQRRILKGGMWRP